MEEIWNWVKARLNEPSTWAGISAAAGAVSVSLESHAGLAGAVIAALVAIVKAEQ